MDTDPEVILGLHVDCLKEGFKALQRDLELVLTETTIKNAKTLAT